MGPGWESQFAADQFGHFTLACELYPLLAAADGARVVINSSAGPALTDIRWHDPHFRTGYDKWPAYGQAKTANALFAVHLVGHHLRPPRRPRRLLPGGLRQRRHLLPKAPMDDGGVRAFVIDPDAATRLWDASLAATGTTPITR